MAIQTKNIECVDRASLGMCQISVVRVVAGGQDKKSWVVIGGERGKSRPCWIGVFCDWSRAGEREAIFAQIRELSIKVTSPEAEVKKAEAEVKMSGGVY